MTSEDKEMKNALVIARVLKKLQDEGVDAPLHIPEVLYLTLFKHIVQKKCRSSSVYYDEAHKVYVVTVQYMGYGGQQPRSYTERHKEYEAAFMLAVAGMMGIQ